MFYHVIDMISDGFSLGADQKGRPLMMNDDSALALDRPLTYDNSDDGGEFNYNGALDCVSKSVVECSGGPKSETPYGNSDHDGLPSGRSRLADSAPPTETSFQPTGGFRAGTLGLDIVRKVVALDRMVAEELQRAGGRVLLDLESPLPVKKFTVKVTKHNFVSFQDAEVRGMDAGRLEYLSVDPAKDRVYAECVFDRLGATGAFKTNMQHTRAGRFAVDMGRVFSNVTARFHREGRAADNADAAAGTAASTAITLIVTADREEVDVVKESVDEKYRSVLERTVSTEVRNATHKGLVARMKAEASGPLGDGHATRLFDVNWTGDGLVVLTTVAGVQSHTRRSGQDAQVFTSYGRVADGDGTYRVTVKVGLGELRWTADVSGEAEGNEFQLPPVEFSVDDFLVHVTVTKYTDGRNCRDVNVLVQAKGFRAAVSAEDQRLPAEVRRRLSDIVERSFAALSKDYVEREVCNGPATATL